MAHGKKSREISICPAKINSLIASRAVRFISWRHFVSVKHLNVRADYLLLLSPRLLACAWAKYVDIESCFLACARSGISSSKFITPCCALARLFNCPAAAGAFIFLSLCAVWLLISDPNKTGWCCRFLPSALEVKLPRLWALWATHIWSISNTLPKVKPGVCCLLFAYIYIRTRQNLANAPFLGTNMRRNPSSSWCLNLFLLRNNYMRRSKIVFPFGSVNRSLRHAAYHIYRRPARLWQIAPVVNE